MSESRIKARADLEKLVLHFEKNIYQFKAPTFNEAQTRQFLIDPFFEVLGWDISNKQMLPPYKIEVLPEGRVKSYSGKSNRNQEQLFSSETAVKEEQKEYASFLEYIADDEYKAEQRVATKKPDYRFRIGGSTKFFVEAKKPSVDLMNSMDSIFQIKRYGFSARVPISVLTDFEELRVFDCTKRPFYDKPKIGALKEFDLSWKTYLDEFDRLYDTFSREAVLAGSIETLQKKYLQKKTGEFLLDKSFLDDLSDWRVELAQDIARHPKNRRIIDSHTLNECVQRILDRIVFLRVCEDRAIEEVGTLLALLRLWQDHPGLSLYEKFNELVGSRRSLYNGLLFAEHESERLEVGNKVLEKIFKNINYPLSPYHFDEIGVEILGSIYERFLGKTIRLTKKQVRVEEKPEVRKAGGVYYTPQYIVNYIVDNTVGKLIEGKSPRQIAKLKIIDIACGSGSFLLGAFQKLIDYHIQWYSEHPEDVKETHGVRDAYEGNLGQLHISARKKREILVNNIFGVDIDQQAVEVTQMSLYLKVLEDENDQTLNKPTMLALHEVLLPPLRNNIKCGNSLIGTDFLSQGDLFDDEARRKVNPFDWEMEFPEIMKSGGFDCVIGNPPYVRQEELQQSKEYFQKHFEAFRATADLYVSFVEKGLSILSRHGLFGMILSNKWLRASYGEPLRKYLSKKISIHQIVDFAGLPVFPEVTVRTIIMICSTFHDKNRTIRYLAPVPMEEFESITDGGDIENLMDKKGIDVSASDLADSGWSFSSQQQSGLIKKLSENSSSLKEHVNGMMYRGIISGFNEAFMIDDTKRKKLIAENKGSAEIIKPLVVGKDIRRYSLEPKNRYVIWTYVGVPIRKYPAILKHLRKYQKELEKRWDQGNHWWELRSCDYYDKFESPKIIYPDISTVCRFTLDKEGYFSSNTTYFISGDDRYLLAILNSKLGLFYFKEVCAGLESSGATYLRFFGQYIEEFPVHNIGPGNPSEKGLQTTLVTLADEMMEFHRQLNKASFDTEREPIERQIAATDRKIDELVYKLYGLTEEEIKIVEGEK